MHAPLDWPWLCAIHACAPAQCARGATLPGAAAEPCCLVLCSPQVQSADVPTGKLYNLTVTAINTPGIPSGVVKVIIPSCQPGEEERDAQCALCPPNRFCLAPGEETRCQLCLTNAECEAGLLLPKVRLALNPKP